MKKVLQAFQIVKAKKKIYKQILIFTRLCIILAPLSLITTQIFFRNRPWQSLINASIEYFYQLICLVFSLFCFLSSSNLFFLLNVDFNYFFLILSTFNTFCSSFYFKFWNLIGYFFCFVQHLHKIQSEISSLDKIFGTQILFDIRNLSST